MNIRNGVFFMVAVAAMLVSGCAKYKPKQLDRLATTFSSTQEPRIEFAHKVLSNAETKKYLDRDVIAKGYQPIHFTVANKTGKHLNFSQGGLSMECVPAEEIAPQVHTSTVLRVLGYGIPGLIFWPLLIPAVVDGMGFGVFFLEFF